MYKTIENLRKKPDHHKRSVVLATSLGVTAVIFVVWLSFIKMEFANIDLPPEVAEKNSPLVFIKENIANVYESIQSGLGKMKYQAPQ